MRRLVTTAAALGAAAGILVLWRRRADGGASRADLYFSDGSMLSLDADAPEIDGLLRTARAAVGRFA